jgi:sarcosine oxidase delta subunit
MSDSLRNNHRGIRSEQYRSDSSGKRASLLVGRDRVTVNPLKEKFKGKTLVDNLKEMCVKI